MSKSKFSLENKIQECEDLLSGKYSAAQICKRYGIWDQDLLTIGMVNDMYVERWNDGVRMLS